MLRMLPFGFKKDSRVWLHKNASKFLRKPSLLAGCDCNSQRLGSDDPYVCVPHDQNESLEHIITDASGKVYKKDSRTWLHKSSRKKMKPSQDGDLTKEMVCGLNVTDVLDGSVRTRSSTEVVRAHNGISKVKKKKMMMLMSLMVNQQSGRDGGLTSAPEIRQHKDVFNKYRSSVKRASYHDLTESGKRCTAVSDFASDLCIADKDRTVSRIDTQDGLPDSDIEQNEIDDDVSYNDQDDFGDDTNMDVRDENFIHNEQTRADERRLDYQRAPYWNRSAVEVTRDGLRELERMMEQQQSQRRAARLAKSFLHHPKHEPECEVSPQSLSSDSRLSLDANVNLSEEFISGSDLNQSQTSAELLSQATEYLHVCSPGRKTCRR